MLSGERETRQEKVDEYNEQTEEMQNRLEELRETYVEVGRT